MSWRHWTCAWTTSLCTWLRNNLSSWKLRLTVKLTSICAWTHLRQRGTIPLFSLFKSLHLASKKTCATYTHIPTCAVEVAPQNHAVVYTSFSALVSAAVVYNLRQQYTVITPWRRKVVMGFCQLAPQHIPPVYMYGLSLYTSMWKLRQCLPCMLLSLLVNS